MAVVTPNCAIDKRSHTNSYRTLQNPDVKKKIKYQYNLVLRWLLARNLNIAMTLGNECKKVAGTVQVANTFVRCVFSRAAESRTAVFRQLRPLTKKLGRVGNHRGFSQEYSFSGWNFSTTSKTKSIEIR
jgi:hypothetical protein